MVDEFISSKELVDLEWELSQIPLDKEYDDYVARIGRKHLSTIIQENLRLRELCNGLGDKVQNLNRELVKSQESHEESEDKYRKSEDKYQKLAKRLSNSMDIA